MVSVPNFLGSTLLKLSVPHGGVIQHGVDDSNAMVFQQCQGPHIQVYSGNIYGSLLPNRFLKF